MAKAFNIEGALAAAGINVAGAKAKIKDLDAAFGGEAGDIPDGVLTSWTNEFFDPTVVRGFFVLLGKYWESELEIPDERKWEKGPNAAEEKAKRNLEKAAPPENPLAGEVADLKASVAELKELLTAKAAK